MESKVDIIKGQLTGDVQKDVELLQNLYNECNLVIEDAHTTIEAIGIVLEELKQTEEKTEIEVEENVENNEEQREEIDAMIETMIANFSSENNDIAIEEVENIIDRLENLTKSEENKIYCSFNSDYEKILFYEIFADEKEVESTPYSNDTIYRIYADLLISKDRKNDALKALDRAIFWNFLNRDARKDKLNIYLERKEYLKYIETIKSIQNISYTPEDIADCYNEFAFIFKELNDLKSSYSMYRISYTFFENESVDNVLKSFETVDETLKEMTEDEIIDYAEKNSVYIGANKKIIAAQRNMVSRLIDNEMYEAAKIILENDYGLTLDDETAELYKKILEMEELQNAEIIEEVEEKKPIKKKTTTKKTTTITKKPASTTKKKSTTAKKTAKKEESKK